MLSSSSFSSCGRKAHHLEKGHVVVYGAQGLQLADFMPQQGSALDGRPETRRESFVARAAPALLSASAFCLAASQRSCRAERMSSRPLSRAGSIKAVEILGVGIDHGNNLAQNLFRKAHLHPADNAPVSYVLPLRHDAQNTGIKGRRPRSIGPSPHAGAPAGIHSGLERDIWRYCRSLPEHGQGLSGIALLQSRVKARTILRRGSRWLRVIASAISLSSAAKSSLSVFFSFSEIPGRGCRLERFLFSGFRFAQSVKPVFLAHCAAGRGPLISKSPAGVLPDFSSASINLLETGHALFAGSVTSIERKASLMSSRPRVARFSGVCGEVG